MLRIVFQLVPVYGNFRTSLQIFDCIFLNASLRVAFWDPPFIHLREGNVLGFLGSSVVLHHHNNSLVFRLHVH